MGSDALAECADQDLGQHRDVRELYLSYWSSIVDQSYDTLGNLVSSAPFPNLTVSAINARMFRSPLRTPPPIGTGTPAGRAAVPTYRLMPSQMVQLRAAIAAVNTIDMRDNDDDVTSRRVTLTATEAGALFPVVVATVYGNEPQPFITEVYATNAAVSPALGYVAVKLFNPYNFPLSLANYKFGTIARSSAVATSLIDFNRTIVEVIPDNPAAFWLPGTAPVIPAGGYVIITSGSNSYGLVTMPNVVTAPTGAAPPLTAGQVAMYTMSNLATALDKELVLVRPRRSYNPTTYGADGSPTAATGSTTHNPVSDFNETSITDMVPVDSYDLSGLPPVGTDIAIEWHYLRPSDPEQSTLDQQTSWHWVYPGHYRFSTVTTPNPFPLEDVTGSTTTLPPRLVDGTHRGKFPGHSFDLTVIPGRPATYADNQLWTMSLPYSPIATPQTNQAIYRDIPIRLNTPDSGGPNNPLHQTRNIAPAVEPNAFPFGGFARNGDILQVPFIGSYKLQTPAQVNTINFMEMNPVTMDSMMALSAAQMNWNETQTDTDTTTGNCDPIQKLLVSPAQVSKTWGGLPDGRPDHRLRADRIDQHGYHQRPGNFARPVAVSLRHEAARLPDGSVAAAGLFPRCRPGPG